MHVLILSPFLWSGAGAAVTRLAIEFTKRGDRCEVVSSGESRGLTDWEKYVCEIKRAGIRYRKIDLFDRDAASVWTSIGAVSELIAANDYDLIHVHSGVPALVAGIARENTKKNVPIIATFHSWNPSRPQWMNWSDKWALNRCDRIVADSASYMEHLIKNGVDPKKAEVIHLGVNVPRVTKRNGRISPREEFRVLSVGRIERRKDQETLIRAFAEFRREVNCAVLDLVGPAGEEDYERQLRRRSKLYGWDLGVHFTGMVDNTEVYYREADLYISTSLDEGLGLALLEAMAYSLPSLSTSIPGHRDFAHDGTNTWEIPTGDYQTVARKMIELYHSPKTMKRLGCNARRMVELSFGWSNTVAQYSRLYNEVLNHSREETVRALEKGLSQQMSM